MLEGALARTLNSVLGWLLEDVNASDLKLGVFGGNVSLENLRIKPDALSKLGIPLSIRSGILGKLKLKVPWTNISSSPLILELEGLTGTLSMLPESEALVVTAATDSTSNKGSPSVNSGSSAATANADENSGGVHWTQTFTGKLVVKMIQNLQITIRNIDFRIETEEFAVGVSLGSLNVESQSFLTFSHDVETLLVSPKDPLSKFAPVYKVIAISGLKLYWASPTKQADLLKPVSLQLSLRLLLNADQGVKSKKSANDAAVHPNHPGLVVEFSVKRIELVATTHQVEAATRFLNKRELETIRMKYRHLRPSCSVHDNQRDWWQFAFKCIQLERRDQQLCGMWETIMVRKNQRQQYIEAYVEKILAGSNVEIQLLEKLARLERYFDHDLILCFREAAHAIVVKRETESSNSKQQGSGVVGWMTSWFSSSSTPTTTKSEKDPSKTSTFSLTPEEMKELYTVIEYNEHEANTVAQAKEEQVNLHPNLLNTVAKVGFQQVILTLTFSHDSSPCNSTLQGSSDHEDISALKDVNQSDASESTILETLTFVQESSTALVCLFQGGQAARLQVESIQLFDNITPTKFKTFPAILDSKAALPVISIGFASPPGIGASRVPQLGSDTTQAWNRPVDDCRTTKTNSQSQDSKTSDAIEGNKTSENMYLVVGNIQCLRINLSSSLVRVLMIRMQQSLSRIGNSNFGIEFTNLEQSPSTVAAQSRIVTLPPDLFYLNIVFDPPTIILAGEPKLSRGSQEEQPCLTLKLGRLEVLTGGSEKNGSRTKLEQNDVKQQTGRCTPELNWTTTKQDHHIAMSDVSFSTSAGYILAPLQVNCDLTMPSLESDKGVVRCEVKAQPCHIEMTIDTIRELVQLGTDFSKAIQPNSSEKPVTMQPETRMTSTKQANQTSPAQSDCTMSLVLNHKQAEAMATQVKLILLFVMPKITLSIPETMTLEFGKLDILLTRKVFDTQIQCNLASVSLNAGCQNTRIFYCEDSARDIEFPWDHIAQHEDGDPSTEHHSMNQEQQNITSLRFGALLRDEACPSRVRLLSPVAAMDKVVMVSLGPVNLDIQRSSLLQVKAFVDNVLEDATMQMEQDNNVASYRHGRTMQMEEDNNIAFDKHESQTDEVQTLHVSSDETSPAIQFLVQFSKLSVRLSGDMMDESYLIQDKVDSDIAEMLIGEIDVQFMMDADSIAAHLSLESLIFKDLSSMALDENLILSLSTQSFVLSMIPGESSVNSIVIDANFESPISNLNFEFINDVVRYLEVFTSNETQNELESLEWDASDINQQQSTTESKVMYNTKQRNDVKQPQKILSNPQNSDQQFPRTAVGGVLPMLPATNISIRITNAALQLSDKRASKEDRQGIQMILDEVLANVAVSHHEPRLGVDHQDEDDLSQHESVGGTLRGRVSRFDSSSFIDAMSWSNTSQNDNIDADEFQDAEGGPLLERGISDLDSSAEPAPSAQAASTPTLFEPRKLEQPTKTHLAQQATATMRVGGCTCLVVAQRDVLPVFENPLEFEAKMAEYKSELGVLDRLQASNKLLSGLEVLISSDLLSSLTILYNNALKYSSPSNDSINNEALPTIQFHSADIASAKTEEQVDVSMKFDNTHAQIEDSSNVVNEEASSNLSDFEYPSSDHQNNVTANNSLVQSFTPHVTENMKSNNATTGAPVDIMFDVPYFAIGFFNRRTSVTAHKPFARFSVQEINTKISGDSLLTKLAVRVSSIDSFHYTHGSQVPLVSSTTSDAKELVAVDGAFNSNLQKLDLGVKVAGIEIRLSPLLLLEFQELISPLSTLDSSDSSSSSRGGVSTNSSNVTSEVHSESDGTTSEQLLPFQFDVSCHAHQVGVTLSDNKVGFRFGIKKQLVTCVLDDHQKLSTTFTVCGMEVRNIQSDSVILDPFDTTISFTKQSQNSYLSFATNTSLRVKVRMSDLQQLNQLSSKLANEQTTSTENDTVTKESENLISLDSIGILSDERTKSLNCNEKFEATLNVPGVEVVLLLKRQPLLRFSLQTMHGKFQSFVRINEDFTKIPQNLFTCGMVLRSDAMNLLRGTWEPLLEPWILGATMESPQILKNIQDKLDSTSKVELYPSKMHVLIHSQHQLNLTVTQQNLKTITKLGELFEQTSVEKGEAQHFDEIDMTNSSIILQSSLGGKCKIAATMYSGSPSNFVQAFSGALVETKRQVFDPLKLCDGVFTEETVWFKVKHLDINTNKSDNRSSQPHSNENWRAAKCVPSNFGNWWEFRDPSTSQVVHRSPLSQTLGNATNTPQLNYMLSRADLASVPYEVSIAVDRLEVGCGFELKAKSHTVSVIASSLGAKQRIMSVLATLLQDNKRKGSVQPVEGALDVFVANRKYQSLCTLTASQLIVQPIDSSRPKGLLCTGSMIPLDKCAVASCEHPTRFLLTVASHSDISEDSRLYFTCQNQSIRDWWVNEITAAVLQYCTPLSNAPYKSMSQITLSIALQNVSLLSALESGQSLSLVLRVPHLGLCDVIEFKTTEVQHLVFTISSNFVSVNQPIEIGLYKVENIVVSSSNDLANVSFDQVIANCTRRVAKRIEHAQVLLAKCLGGNPDSPESWHVIQTLGFAIFASGKSISGNDPLRSVSELSQLQSEVELLQSDENVSIVESFVRMSEGMQKASTPGKQSSYNAILSGSETNRVMDSQHGNLLLCFDLVQQQQDIPVVIWHCGQLAQQSFSRIPLEFPELNGLVFRHKSPQHEWDDLFSTLNCDIYRERGSTVVDVSTGFHVSNCSGAVLEIHGTRLKPACSDIESLTVDQSSENFWAKALGFEPAKQVIDDSMNSSAKREAVITVVRPTRIVGFTVSDTLQGNGIDLELAQFVNGGWNMIPCELVSSDASEQQVALSSSFVQGISTSPSSKFRLRWLGQETSDFRSNFQLLRCDTDFDHTQQANSGCFEEISMQSEFKLPFELLSPWTVIWVRREGTEALESMSSAILLGNCFQNSKQVVSSRGGFKFKLNPLVSEQTSQRFWQLQVHDAWRIDNRLPVPIYARFVTTPGTLKSFKLSEATVSPIECIQAGCSFSIPGQQLAEWQTQQHNVYLQLSCATTFAQDPQVVNLVKLMVQGSSVNSLRSDFQVPVGTCESENSFLVNFVNCDSIRSCVHVALSVPTWITNMTEVNLVVKDVPAVPIKVTDEDGKSITRQIWLVAAKSVQLGHDNSDESVRWSNQFSTLVATGEVEWPDKNHNLGILVKGSQLPSPFQSTRSMQLLPRFFVVNETNYDLTMESKSCLAVVPKVELSQGLCAPFYGSFGNEKRDGVCLKLPNLESTTSPFSPANVARHLLSLPKEQSTPLHILQLDGKPSDTSNTSLPLGDSQATESNTTTLEDVMVVQVVPHIHGSTLTILRQLSSWDEAPFCINNLCSHWTVCVSQAVGSTNVCENSTTCVEPGTSKPFWFQDTFGEQNVDVVCDYSACAPMLPGVQSDESDNLAERVWESIKSSFQRIQFRDLKLSTVGQRLTKEVRWNGGTMKITCNVEFKNGQCVLRISEKLSQPRTEIKKAFGRLQTWIANDLISEEFIERNSNALNPIISLRDPKKRATGYSWRIVPGESRSNNESSEKAFGILQQHLRSKIAQVGYSSLMLCVMEARQLPGMDMRLLPGSTSFATSDPYVIVKLQGKVVLESKTHWQDCNPVFLDIVELPTDVPSQAELEIEVWDKDILSRNDLIGTCKFKCSHLYDCAKHGTVDLWVPLQGKDSGSGKIRLVIDNRATLISKVLVRRLKHDFGFVSEHSRKAKQRKIRNSSNSFLAVPRSFEERMLRLRPGQIRLNLPQGCASDSFYFVVKTIENHEISEDFQPSPSHETPGNSKPEPNHVKHTPVFAVESVPIARANQDRDQRISAVIHTQKLGLQLQEAMKRRGSQASTQGGKASRQQLLVREIAAGSPLDLDSSVTIGDELVQVGNTGVRGKTLEQVKTLLKECGRPVRLEFSTHRQEIAASETRPSCFYVPTKKFQQGIEIESVPKSTTKIMISLYARHGPLLGEHVDQSNQSSKWRLPPAVLGMGSSFKSEHNNQSLSHEHDNEQQADEPKKSNIPQDSLSKMDKELLLPLFKLYGTDVEEQAALLRYEERLGDEDILWGSSIVHLPTVGGHADALMWGQEAVVRTSLLDPIRRNTWEVWRGSIDLHITWVPMLPRPSELVSLSCAIDAAGLGVSIVDVERRYTEMLFASFQGVQAYFSQHCDGRMVTDLAVHRFQIDNQLTETLHPVMLSPTCTTVSSQINSSTTESDDEDNDSTPSLPCIKSTFVIQNSGTGPRSPVMVEYAVVYIQELNAKVDEALLLALDQFSNDISQQESKENDKRDQPLEMVMNSFHNQLARNNIDGLLDEVEATTQVDQNVYIQWGEVKPFRINLTVSMFAAEGDASQGDDTKRRLVQVMQGVPVLEEFSSIIVDTLANITDAPLRFSPLVFSNMALTTTSVSTLASAHYTRELKAGVIRIVGSTDFLGNPVQLVQVVSSGALSFFYEPAMVGLTLDPKALGRAFTRGGRTLLQAAARGVFSTTERVSGTLSLTLARLTLDKEYIRKRTKSHWSTVNEPTNALEGVCSGANSLSLGVLEGVKGVLVEPIRGLTQGGLVGFTKGIGYGVVGVVAQPIAGVLDAVTSLSQGIRNSAHLEASHAVSQRLRRHFTSVTCDGKHSAKPPRLYPYCAWVATGAAMLKALAPGSSLDYVYHDFVCDERGNQVVLMVTDESVMTIHVSHNKKRRSSVSRLLWSFPLSMVDVKANLDNKTAVTISVVLKSAQGEALVPSGSAVEDSVKVVTCKNSVQARRLCEVVQIAQSATRDPREMVIEWATKDAASTILSNYVGVEINENDEVLDSTSSSQLDSNVSNSASVQGGIVADVVGGIPRAASVTGYTWRRDHKNRRYVAYEISVIGGDAYSSLEWKVYRRYSEFEALRDQIAKQLGVSRIAFRLPPKTLFGRFLDATGLAQRQDGLNDMLAAMTTNQGVVIRNEFVMFLTRDACSITKR